MIVRDFGDRNNVGLLQPCGIQPDLSDKMKSAVTESVQQFSASLHIDCKDRLPLKHQES